MEYVHYYETQSEFNADYNGSGYTEPWVGYVEETSGTSYNKKPGEYSVSFYECNDFWSPTQADWEEMISQGPFKVLRFENPEDMLDYVPPMGYVDQFYGCWGSNDAEATFYNDFSSVNYAMVNGFGSLGSDNLSATIKGKIAGTTISLADVAVEYLRQHKNINVGYYESSSGA